MLDFAYAFLFLSIYHRLQARDEVKLGNSHHGISRANYAPLRIVKYAGMI